MPHQCAHWFAMTCRRQRRFSGCKDVAYDMLKTVACQRVQGGRVRRVRRNLPGVCGCKDVPPIVIARSGATWQSVTLRQDMAKGNTLGEYERCCGFAQSIANLLAFPAGTRIAAPVCALVRNDMQKTGTCSRVQGRLPRGHAKTYNVPAGERTPGGKFAVVFLTPPLPYRRRSRWTRQFAG